MNQREAFEAWKRRELKNMDLTDFPIEVVRDAWQAAIQHATELGAPDGKRVETINDYDGMVAYFWRAVAADPDAVPHHADWPVNENDLFARHS